MTLRNSKIFIVVLTLISLSLLGVLILGIYVVQVKNNEISELLNTADSVTETRILAQSIRTAQRNALEDIQAFDNIVISEDKLVLFIESIEESGRALDLETNIISVEDKEESPDVHLINIVIESDGTWTSILSFLRTVENLPNRVMIDKASLYKEGSSWRSRFVLTLYSFD